MAETLPFLDSFDHYLTAQITRKWTAASVSAAIGPGRNGNGMNPGAGGTFKTFSADRATMTAGLAYKTAAFANQPILFKHTAANPIAALHHVTDGRFRVTAGNPFAPLAQSANSTFVMNLDQWYYLEMQVTATRFTLTYEVRVNGSIVPILAGVLGGIDFGAGGAELMNVYECVGAAGITPSTIDDLYITESDFLGDIQIDVLRPDGDGAHSAWTPNGGVANYDRVLDITPDDDVTCLFAAAVGLKTTHALEDIVATGPIKAAQILVCTKKSDAGACEVNSILHDAGGAEDAGDTYLPSDTSYLYTRKGYLVSPFTGLPFSQAEINGLESGMERTT